VIRPVSVRRSNYPAETCGFMKYGDLVDLVLGHQSAVYAFLMALAGGVMRSISPLVEKCSAPWRVGEWCVNRSSNVTLKDIREGRFAFDESR